MISVGGSAARQTGVSLPRRPVQQAAHAEPIGEAGGPTGEGFVGGSEADAVRALRVYMHLGRDAGLVQGLVIEHAVLHRHDRIVAGVEEERGRRSGGDLQLIREAFDQLGIGIRSQQIVARAAVCMRICESNHRVSEHGEIRAAGNAVDGIGCFGVTGIEMSGGGGSEVAAGGESHDADAVGQHAIGGGFGAHGADGALRVAQFDGVMIARAEAILEHKSGDRNWANYHGWMTPPAAMLTF